MVEAAIMKHNITWSAPLPLWAQNTSIGIQIRGQQPDKQPAILRFANDSFMEELTSMLAQSPWRLSDWVAQPETWRQPMKAPRPVLKPKAEKPVAFLFNKTKSLTQKQSATKKRIQPQDALTLAQPVEGDGNNTTLKLYQSGHQRYYLVTASLISDQGGYPEKTLDLSKNERVTFVMRRIIPSSKNVLNDYKKWNEYAFVSTPHANGFVWKKVATKGSNASKKMIPGEEQLPLFPLNYNDECSRNRKLHGGLIPVGKRETWLSAPIGEAATEYDTDKTRQTEEIATSLARTILQQDIATPWKILIEQAQNTKDSLKINANTFPNFNFDSIKANADKAKVINSTRDQIQTGSWYILLDFAKYLQQYLPKIWSVVTKQKSKSTLDADEQKFIGYLEQTKTLDSLKSALVTLPKVIQDNKFVKNVRYKKSDVKNSLLDALAQFDELLEKDLESVDTLFKRYDEKENPLPIDNRWPDFLFPLADPDISAPVPPITDSAMSELTGVELLQAKIDALVDKIEKLLPASAQEPTDQTMSSQPIINPGEAWFVVRCVYERPNCGPLFTPLVSTDTRRFQLAPFFDPDAPARPIRIPMPVDISLAGLRKFRKNVGFVMSDMLCGQIKRIRKFTLGDLVLSVLPWPFHKDLPDPGKTGPCSDSGGNFGMICSLSIPIVTLCALIMLMIIVSLFDIFFRWIPYFFLCLPIPGLKGKK